MQFAASARCRYNESGELLGGSCVVQALHNMSAKAYLVIGTQDEEKHARWREVLKGASQKYVPGLAESACLVMRAGDGRLSIKGQKVVFGYQVVASTKFGKEALKEIESVKGADSLLISHLCGTRNCLVPEHLVLETKAINDQRTMCHFVMRNVLHKSGRDGLAQAMALGLCLHSPPCGSEDKKATVSAKCVTAESGS